MVAFLLSHVLLIATTVPQDGRMWLAISADRGLETAAKAAQAQFAKVEKNLLYVLSETAPDRTLAVHLVSGSLAPVVSQGSMTVGASYGGFPKKTYAMDVALAEFAVDQTFGHFSEPVWGPALGDFVPIEAVKRSGHFDEAFYDVRTRYRKALKADPTFRKVNLAGEVPADVRRAKGLWMIWQFQVRYPPDFLRQYLRLRKRVVAKTPDDVAAMIANCTGTDQSLWFQFYGTKVDAKRSKLKF